QRCRGKKCLNTVETGAQQKYKPSGPARLITMSGQTAVAIRLTCLSGRARLGRPARARLHRYRWPGTIRPIEQCELQTFGDPLRPRLELGADRIVKQFVSGFLEQREPALEQCRLDARNREMLDDRITLVAAGTEHHR